MVGKIRTSIFVLAVSLLLQTVSFAQVPWRKFTYFTNFGGLNDNLSSTEIKNNEATDIQNIIFDTGGALKKRFGYTTVGDTASQATAVGTGADISITGLKFFKEKDGDRFLVAVTNRDSSAALYKKDYTVGGGPTGNWDNINQDILSGTYTDDDQVDFAIASDWCVFALGSGTKRPFAWKGQGVATSLTADTDLASATLVEYHKNHLFVNDARSFNNSRVMFSNLDDITTYTATDFFDVQTQDGSQVRGLISAFDSLYVFKDSSIWRLSGDERDSFRLDKMVEGIGTLSQGSIQVVNNLLYFITKQNDIAAYDGAYTVIFPSQKIRNTISGLNYSRSQNALGIPYSTYRNDDVDYYAALSSAGAGGNDKVLLFDTFHKAWTKFVGFNPNAWTIGEDSNGKNILYFGDYNGNVHSYPSTTFFDGNVSTTAITAFYQTKWWRYPNIALGHKYFRLLKTYALSSDDTILQAEIRADFESTGGTVSINLDSSLAQWDVFLWDVGLWGGDTVIIGRNEVNKGKEFFQIKYIFSTATNRGTTLLGFSTFIEPTDQI